MAIGEHSAEEWEANKIRESPYHKSILHHQWQTRGMEIMILEQNFPVTAGITLVGTLYDLQ